MEHARCNAGLFLLSALFCLHAAAADKKPGAEAPDPDLLEYLVMFDEPGVPLPEPDKSANPAAEAPRPVTMPVKKP